VDNTRGYGRVSHSIDSGLTITYHALEPVRDPRSTPNQLNSLIVNDTYFQAGRNSFIIHNRLYFAMAVAM